MLDNTVIGFLSDAAEPHHSRCGQWPMVLIPGTQITDAGLANVKGPNELERLDFAGTKVTAAGIAELKKALPTAMSRSSPPDLAPLTLPRSDCRTSCRGCCSCSSHTPPRQSLYGWCLEPHPEGAAHETSAVTGVQAVAAAPRAQSGGGGNRTRGPTGTN